MGHRVQRIDWDWVAAEPMLNDRSFVGTVRDKRPKIQENARAESPDDDCHDDEQNEQAPSHREIPVDDPGEDGQDGERNGIFVFQNQPVHLMALS